MNYYLIDDRFYSSDELYHHGIKGMKWGVRRYQNKDGTLTAAGKKRVMERSGEYLKPYYEEKRYANREIVADKWYDEVKNLRDTLSFGSQEWSLAKAKITLDYMDEYADATIKDLKLKNTEQTKAFIQNMFNEQLKDDRAVSEYYRIKNDKRSLEQKLADLDAEYKIKIAEADKISTGHGDLMWDEWQAAREYLEEHGYS